MVLPVHHSHEGDRMTKKPKHNGRCSKCKKKIEFASSYVKKKCRWMEVLICDVCAKRAGSTLR